MVCLSYFVTHWSFEVYNNQKKFKTNQLNDFALMNNRKKHGIKHFCQNIWRNTSKKNPQIFRKTSTEAFFVAHRLRGIAAEHQGRSPKKTGKTLTCFSGNIVFQLFLSIFRQQNYLIWQKTWFLSIRTMGEQ